MLGKSIHIPDREKGEWEEREKNKKMRRTEAESTHYHTLAHITRYNDSRIAIY